MEVAALLPRVHSRHEAASMMFSPGLTGLEFKFNVHGDGPARYNIIHYKQVSRGLYEWVNVGYFHNDQMELKMEGNGLSYYIDMCVTSTVIHFRTPVPL